MLQCIGRCGQGKILKGNKQNRFGSRQIGIILKPKTIECLNHEINLFTITEQGNGKEYYAVKARIAQLDKNFKNAESIYLENQAINEAIEMYQSIYKWEEAIDVAEAKVN